MEESAGSTPEKAESSAINSLFANLFKLIIGQAVVATKINREALLTTIFYYFRSAFWTLVLILYVDCIGQIDHLQPFKAGIGYAIQLVLLIVLKLHSPEKYILFEWFCTPSIIFLKSWISLFFFCYLVQLPSDLSTVESQQIVSWIFQCGLGNVISLYICVAVVSFSIKIIEVFVKPEKNEDTGNNCKQPQPALDLNTECNRDVSEEINRMRRSSLRPLDLISNLDKSKNRQAHAENLYLESNLNSGSQYVADELGSIRSFAKSGVALGSNRMSLSRALTLTRQDVISMSASEAPEMVVNQSDLRVSFLSGGKFRLSQLVGTSARGTPARYLSRTNSKNSLSELGSIELKPLPGTHSPAINPMQGQPVTRQRSVNIVAVEGEEVDIERNSGSEGGSVLAAKDRETFDKELIARLSQQIADSQAEDVELVIAVPFIPSMDQLSRLWIIVAVVTALLSFLCPRKTQSAVVAFQLAATVVVFIYSTTHRQKLVCRFHWSIQTALQSFVIFALCLIPLVILSSKEGTENWREALGQYIIPIRRRVFYDIPLYGAGNYLTVFLNPAIVSLSFQTVEPIMEYYRLLPLILTSIVVACFCIYFQNAIISCILQSPSAIAYPLLIRTVTIPVALELKDLFGGSAGITVGTVLLNGMIALRNFPVFLNYLNVQNPVTRGIAASTAGTLLGVVSLDDKGEAFAAGIGMAGFGVATIAFALIMSVAPFQEFLADLATGNV